MEKSSFENKSIENFEKGQDVEVHVLFTRHAEKDSHGGDITVEGQKDAQQFGKLLKRLESMKYYDVQPATHSGHKRTAGTAFLINNSDLPLENFSRIEINSKRGTGKTLDSSVDRYSEKADQKYSELAAGNYASEVEAVEYFAKLNEERYDEGTPSSAEMSKLVAKDLLDIIDSTKELPAHSKTFFTNIIHSGIFEHFIIDILNKRGEENPIESTGGPLGFLGEDDFRVYIKRELPDKVSINFRFRDRNKNGTMRYYSLSEEDLRAISL
jgi:hypothetical protein